MTIIVDNETCTKCGICSEVCPMKIISPPVGEDERFVEQERPGECISCGQCTAFCPTGALTLQQDTGVNLKKVWDGKELHPVLLASYLKSRRSIRNYRKEPVPREIIEAILDIARYAASGGNGQPVKWLVIHDPGEVLNVARSTIDWMRTLVGSSHPMSGYIPSLLSAWDNGIDVICRGAPHLLIPHIPEDNQIAAIDAIIALTHVDIAAPAFGIGTCWGGFVSIASGSSAKVRESFALPAGRKPAYALMFGYPRYKPAYIPQRNHADITWR